jgi:hypothetical protein
VPRRVVGLALASALVGGSAGWLLAPAVTMAADPPFVVVASGLHSPRGLAFGSGGHLFVAQAGDAAANGSIIEIGNAMSRNPKISTVVSDLATLSTGTEGEYLGVSGISVRGNGANAAIYAVMGESPQAVAEPFGSLLSVTPNGATATVANVGSYDYVWTGDHSGLWKEFPDANPYGVLALPGHIYVADAGANTLDEVRPDGSVQVLAFFPNTALRDAIPTCVAQGPDGALYIGTLALVDSLVLRPSAIVYRVDPAQANLNDPTKTPMTAWATGLWPINGCAFGPGGSFYASELFTDPAAFGVPGAAPKGDVVQIPFATPTVHTSLTGGALGYAGGIAVGPNGDVFVANGTAYVAPGTGQVVRLTTH